MRYVDIENWDRRAAFEYFRGFDDPFFNLTAPVDATGLYRFARRSGRSFALLSLFCSLRAANSVPEFRIRLFEGDVVEFETVHATQTILNDDDTFSFCYFEYSHDPSSFESAGRLAVEKYKRLKTFDVESERIDLIYYSVIPWVAFTSFKHAGRIDKRVSVPRIVFGKVHDDRGRMMLPHSVEVHHALADGLHVGRYFEAFQAALWEFEER
jgi:chloramphenicol O-acetyltransferase type A